MKKAHLNFSNRKDGEFINTLRKRVHLYFKENNLERHGGKRMIAKTIFMTLLYFVPYFLMMFGLVTSSLGVYVIYLFMGLGMAGLGLALMHDANHDVYSKNKRINRIIGGVLNVLGGYDINWKVQHNVLHHSYTNVEGYDDDIDTVSFLRFSPHKERYSIHKYQHIYAWFLYCLMTMAWITTKDFMQIKRYSKMGYMKSFGTETKLMTEMILWKVFYYAYTLIIPLIILPVAWWVIVAGFLSLHFVAGFILSAIFQPAHVMPSSEYPMPDDSGNLENNWAVHQILTTANFAPTSRWFSWLIGGLNFQVEHHLFPNISHVHYRNISAIVKGTAEEFNLPYNSQKSFFAALVTHGKMLKHLGRYDFAGNMPD